MPDLNHPSKLALASKVALNRPSLTPTHLMEIGRAAMACQFEVLLNAGRPENGSELALRALDVVDHLERLLSVYIGDSEFSLLNRQACQAAVIVSEPVFRLIELGKQFHELTGGAFDLTAASLSEAWGFSRRQGRMPSRLEIESALQQMGTRHIELDPDSNSVRFCRSGLKINSGGIGKGFALDRASQILREGGVADFLIHGGKSSILTAGDRHDDRLLVKSGEGFEGGWRIAVKHPMQPNLVLGELCLRDQALGTSGPANQYFYFQGKRYGHIIDPRTGWPAEGLLSTTVIAPSAAQADALATGLYVLGVDAAMKFCKQHTEVGLLAILPGARHGQVEIVSCNLSERTWIPPDLRIVND